MVSIIVPVYNSSKYLRKCIDSILEQSYKELEILLIDDGSTDDSRTICEKYASDDVRVIYKRKKNGGVSSARNQGLALAKGEYIIFVDSDDFLEKEIIEKAIDEIKEKDVDLVIWNALEVNNGITKKCKRINIKQNLDNSIKAALVANYYEDFYWGDYIRAVWGKMFKASLIKKNNLKFNEQLYIGEDAVFMMQYVSWTKKIKSINEYGYFYRILPSSAVRRYKTDLLQQSKIQLHEYIKILGDEINEPVVQSALCVFQWDIFHTLLLNELRAEEKKRCKEMIHDSCIWYQLMQKYNFKCSCKITWANKLVRLQVKIGKRFPYMLQVYLTRIYDWLWKIKNGSKTITI